MEPFLGQIEAFPFGVVPKGWAQCQGQLLSIASNQALFSLLGTVYGGDGVTNFALPDLRGRVAVNTTTFSDLGQRAGAESHTLNINETPAHNHGVSAVVNGASNGTNIPAGTVGLGSSRSTASGNPAVNYYSTAAVAGSMAPTGSTGGQPHENRMPYIALNYCIALVGIYPSRS